MTYRTSRHLSLRSLALIVSVAAMLVVSYALLAPSSASASPYCGGWLGGFGQCWGAERNLTGVSGYGDHHSVCVGIGAISGRCSGGPGQLAIYNWGSVIHAQPRIENNAAGNNFVHGETF